MDGSEGSSLIRFVGGLLIDREARGWGGEEMVADYNNPKPVVQVGAPGSTGLLEITDIIFTTRAPGKRLLFSEERNVF